MNAGYKCPNCEWIGKKPKQRSINKVKHMTCPECKTVVNKWERPENEQVGRCSNCACGSFQLGLSKGHLLRKCKECGQVDDTDDGLKIIRPGDPNKKWVKS